MRHLFRGTRIKLATNIHQCAFESESEKLLSVREREISDGHRGPLSLCCGPFICLSLPCGAISLPQLAPLSVGRFSLEWSAPALYLVKLEMLIGHMLPLLQEDISEFIPTQLWPHICQI